MQYFQKQLLEDRYGYQHSCESKSGLQGNDQLLPAYNVQIGVADEFIAVIDVNHYPFRYGSFNTAPDGEFHEVYGAYP